MARAAEAIDSGDIKARYEASERTLAIMEGLLSCLNRDTPERTEAADNLALYYRTMIMMISQVNVFNDKAACISLERSFRDMASFWRDANQLLEQGGLDRAQ